MTDAASDILHIIESSDWSCDSRNEVEARIWAHFYGGVAKHMPAQDQWGVFTNGACVNAMNMPGFSVTTSLDACRSLMNIACRCADFCIERHGGTVYVTLRLPDRPGESSVGADATGDVCRAWLRAIGAACSPRRRKGD